MTRTRTNATKKIVNDIVNDGIKGASSSQVGSGSPLKGFDGRNRESVETLIQDIEDEVNRCIDAVRRDSRNFCIRLQSDMKCELLKLPPSMRKMKLKNFNKHFGGELRLVVPSNGTMERTKVRPFGLKRVRPVDNYDRTALQTPLKPVPSLPRSLATLRAPRQGEMLMSTNGSPVNHCNEMFATIKKRKVNPGADDMPSALLEVNVDLSMVKNLPSEAKENAWMQLKTVTDELNSIMKKIKEGEREEWGS
uniref:Borealin N-terminal domain-containing protein n=1 Tax=Corethron hystrix TaxID=216773 RepID=A0A7S1BD52_9STRA|mmetsp:Transcript_21619/g.49180  ORF Transcript_21619/g.49180 Transcript_21619/m.49180 type:complete len:250 (+) Transcript_21619:221-970(+)|eukprot:CAMPEP_0113300548 /NCGR_PEP_ID=MMETSP0010_2-20120614/2130_1 /TAXON_ID=216773 ORGANISM="Corethron hystrix, Strain 308" /NCGR_SAMPLE_ID=MMETSP0010_2 /ASSEMBLY_ACC=CAM_ASM_000155 /LENGTH=249 /DNA_ID=CAMNT_0000153987 /DNA_START=168 /DNA_END=917 /DNA_ORIENTATION=- /assembly_acc=CAM_ASM_000155